MAHLTVIRYLCVTGLLLCMCSGTYTQSLSTSLPQTSTDELTTQSLQVQDAQPNSPKDDHNNTFKCDAASYPPINVNSGILVINKDVKSCGFIIMGDAKFFGIKTTNLNMMANDYIEVSPINSNQTTKLFGPFEDGYLLFGFGEAKIVFNFQVTDESSMQIKFVQNIKQLPISCDTKAELQIKAIQMSSYIASFTKSISDPVHIEIVGSSDPFGHYFMNKTSFTKVVTFDVNNPIPITIKLTPALADCSKEIVDTNENSHELSSPTSRKEGYTCVNIFRTDIKSDQAHFDVDFTNFIKLSNLNDELTIYDGTNLLKLAMFQASEYAKQVISFKGTNLAVVYNSPGPFSPTGIPFKLTVKSKSIGGIISKDGPLVIPTNGDASYYTLIPQAGNLATIELEKISGLQLSISDGSSKPIVLNGLDGKVIFPPKIVSSEPGKKLYVSLVSKAKSSGTIKFSSTSTGCGGIYYSASGSISTMGRNKTCYWLVGAQKSLLSMNYNDLNPGGCIEIYSLSREAPIYKRCDIDQNEILPRFYLNQSYVKLTLPSSNTQFHAALSSPVLNVVDISKGNQRNVSSIGYPSMYPWLGQSDNITFNGLNKSMIISIADLDIRAGEKLLVNNQEITPGSLPSLTDIDTSNKVSNIALERSLTTSDFTTHRGYKLVASEYQKIFVADMGKDTLGTPEGLDTLLIKIVAAKGNRVSYDIKFASPELNFKMAVVDSRSVLGRSVYKEELTQGSTTSDTLLVSIITDKNGTHIPKLAIKYNQLACNETDHKCDSQTRCVPKEKLCQGKAYCDDGSDLKVVCSGGPSPPPDVIEKGLGGVSVFLLCILMFLIGVFGTLYGPDVYKSFQGRLRSNQYTTFTSTE